MAGTGKPGCAPRLGVVAMEAAEITAAELARLERETLEDLLAAHERGISRLPASSELRATLERSVPYLRVALEPDPSPGPRARHQRRLSLVSHGL